MKKIAIYSKYNSDGASSRYRFYNYQKSFAAYNLEVKYFPLMGEGYIDSLVNKKRFKAFVIKINGILSRIFHLIFYSREYNLIIIEKELFPNFPYFIEKLLLGGKKYAVDFDDYVGASYKENPIKKIYLGNKVDKLVKNAKFVTVGNLWYFDELKSGNLIYLPTVIDLEKYKEIKSKTNSDEIVIVWIGSPSTVKYLDLIKPVLMELSKRRKVKLRVIGGKFKMENVRVEEVNWNDTTEVEEILSSDIGIMPLYNTKWEKGKCGFKLIQYMACGLPVVASSVPANNEIIINELTGFIAHDGAEWLSCLEKLITNQEIRFEYGLNGRKRVESHYSYQVWGKIYAKLIYENS